MTEHSPTPWKIYDGADPYHVKIMGPYPDIGGPHIADVSGSANAAMIIQAVNLHDRLVDALKDSIRQLLAVSALVGECESLVSSGALNESQERSLRFMLAHVLAAYGFPSKAELEGKPRTCIRRAHDV
jgi:hypothetical protein